MGLVDEGPSEDQGLNHILFYPTETCLQKMLYCAGFRFVYRFTTPPEHPGYHRSGRIPKIRTMLAASHELITSSQLEVVPQPSTPIQPWDAENVAANTSSAEALRGFSQKVCLKTKNLEFSRSPQSIAATRGRQLMFERQLIPVYLPSGVFQRLRALKRFFIRPKSLPEPEGKINLSGDREIEWSYIASRLPNGSGSVLDFGAGHGNMSVHAIQKGYQVLALDLEDNPFHWSHPEVLRESPRRSAQTRYPREIFRLHLELFNRRACRLDRTLRCLGGRNERRPRSHAQASQSSETYWQNAHDHSMRSGYRCCSLAQGLRQEKAA